MADNTNKMNKSVKIWLITLSVVLGLFIIGSFARRAFLGHHYGYRSGGQGHHMSEGHHMRGGHHMSRGHHMRGGHHMARAHHIGGGPGYHGKGFGKFHDAGEEKSITGKVHRVNDYGPKYGIVVDTGSEKLYVGVAPSFYTAKEEISFKEGDSVEIKGKLITIPDTKPFMIAEEIKSGEKTYSLRDENGFPVWAGEGKKWGKRSWGGHPWGMRGEGPCSSN